MKPSLARGRQAIAVGSVLLAALGVCFGHGASRGLHLHPQRAEAAVGETVPIEVNAAEALTHVTIGFVGQRAQSIDCERPTKTVLVELSMPQATSGTVVSVQAEARAVSGEMFRASSVVRVAAKAADPPRS